ncbi:hypothetical protein GCM10008940_29490 [Microbulbifer agarilyticus]
MSRPKNIVKARTIFAKYLYGDRYLTTTMYNIGVSKGYILKGKNASTNIGKGTGSQALGAPKILMPETIANKIAPPYIHFL